MFLLFLRILALNDVAIAQSKIPTDVNIPSIVGGKEVTEEVSWTVSLGLLNARGDKVDHACGGTLIDPYWVLTAKHCFDGNPFASDKPEQVLARIGFNNLDATNVTAINGRRVVLHSTADLALLELSDRSNKSPVILADSSFMNYLEENLDRQTVYAQVFGWGYTSAQGPVSSKLKLLGQPLVKASVCNENWFSPQGGTLVSENDVCSGLLNASEAFCSGDSGGPLMVGNRQIGVINRFFGTNCGDGYDVSVKISNFRTWMRDTIAGSCLQASATANAHDCKPPAPAEDKTAPTATSYNVQISGSTATLTAGGVADTGGSGVSHANFSGKWSGSWHGIQTDSSSPYRVSFDLCQAGVPDGDIEFGLEIHDQAGNVFHWHQYQNNPHATKSFNCGNPTGGTTSGSVKLFSNINYEGSTLWAGGLGFTNEPNSAGFSLAFPSGWSVRVWRDDNKQGASRCFDRSQHNLQDTGWQNAIQSIEVYDHNACGTVSGFITVCSDTLCWNIDPGYVDLTQHDGMNDSLVEFTNIPVDELSVMLFREVGFRGTVECFNRPREIPSGGKYDLKRQASGLITVPGYGCDMKDHWVTIFHSETNQNGFHWSAGVGPGYVNMRDLGFSFFENEAESVNISPARSIVVYTGLDKTGTHSHCWTGRKDDLGIYKNNIKSVEIFENTECRPNAPVNFQSPLTTETTEVVLYWEHHDPDNHSYKIYKWDGDSFEFLVESLPGNHYYFDTGLQCDSSYFYTITAVSGDNESRPAGWVKGVTASCPKPGVPTLSGANPEGGSDTDVLTFNWTPAQYATEYNAVLFDGVNEYTSGFTTATSWTVRDLAPGDYVFNVVARGKSGETSSDTKLISIRPTAPELIDAQATSCTGVGVYWRVNSPNSDTSHLHIKAKGDTGEGLTIRTPVDGTYQAENVSNEYYDLELIDPNTEYQVYITSFSGLYAADSEMVTVTTPACEEEPQIPAAPTITSPASQTFEYGKVFHLYWTAVSGASYYQIELISDGQLDSTWRDEDTDGDFNPDSDYPKAGSYVWRVRAYVPDFNDFTAWSSQASFVLKEVEDPSTDVQIYLPIVTR